MNQMILNTEQETNMNANNISHLGKPEIGDLVPSRYALRIGEIDVLVVSDGVLPLPTATMATNESFRDLRRIGSLRRSGPVDRQPHPFASPLAGEAKAAGNLVVGVTRKQATPAVRITQSARTHVGGRSLNGEKGIANVVPD